MNLTASDRKALIRLASSLPQGSDERKAILAGLKKTSGFAEMKQWWKNDSRNIQAFQKSLLRTLESKGFTFPYGGKWEQGDSRMSRHNWFSQNGQLLWVADPEGQGYAITLDFESDDPEGSIDQPSPTAGAVLSSARIWKNRGNLRGPAIFEEKRRIPASNLSSLSPTLVKVLEG